MPLRGDDHEAARRWCDAAATGAIGTDGIPVQAKAGPAGWSGVSWSAGPSFVDWNRSRRAPAPPELVESFKQVVFACATLNANGVARIPLRLYAATRSGQHRPKCHAKAAGRRDEHRLRTASHLERWTKGAEQIDEVLEHPLLQALNDVNPDWDHNALIRHTVFSLDVIGRAYWWMEPGRRGTTANVWPLLSQYVLPIRDPVTSLVSSYRYFDHDYQPDELVRIRHSSLRDPYALGLAPAEAAFAYVGLSDQFVSLQENLLTQGARPSLIVSNKDASEPIGKEERARFQRDINSSLTRGGTGMAWVVDGAVDVKTLTFPPADLAALQISENAVQRVANCFGVPLSLLKTEDVNLANAEAGHRQHAELAIDPRCILIASALTKWTREEGQRIERSLKARGEALHLGWDRLFWAFDNPVKEDQERNTRIHAMYVKDGVLTINDVRADLGYSAVEWGDEPWLGNSLSQPSDASNEEGSASSCEDRDDAKALYSSHSLDPIDRFVKGRSGRGQRQGRHGNSRPASGGGHRGNPNRDARGRFASGPHKKPAPRRQSRKRSTHALAAAKGFRGIGVTKNGGPDFAGTKYLYKVKPGQSNIIKIELTGGRQKDFRVANGKAGFTNGTPKGYSWHHLDDFNPKTGKATLQLVHRDAHEATYPHRGGVSQYEKHHGRKYKKSV